MKFCFEGCCSKDWVETKPSEYHWNVVHESLFFFWPRVEKAKVALFVFIHCNSFFERRKLECEVYTLLISLYNPQLKVATYSCRKWIEAKHRNKSLRSLLIITRHFSLLANYLNDEVDPDISNDVAMHVWHARYSRYGSAGFLWEKKISYSPWFIFNWENYRRSSDIVLVIIPFYTYHNWTTNPLELLVITCLEQTSFNNSYHSSEFLGKMSRNHSKWPLNRLAILNRGNKIDQNNLVVGVRLL